MRAQISGVAVTVKSSTPWRYEERTGKSSGVVGEINFSPTIVKGGRIKDGLSTSTRILFRFYQAFERVVLENNICEKCTPRLFPRNESRAKGTSRFLDARRFEAFRSVSQRDNANGRDELYRFAIENSVREETGQETCVYRDCDALKRDLDGSRSVYSIPKSGRT